jgi:hypothetical protein
MVEMSWIEEIIRKFLKFVVSVVLWNGFSARRFTGWIQIEEKSNKMDVYTALQWNSYVYDVFLTFCVTYTRIIPYKVL